MLHLISALPLIPSTSVATRTATWWPPEGCVELRGISDHTSQVLPSRTHKHCLPRNTQVHRDLGLMQGLRRKAGGFQWICRSGKPLWKQRRRFTAIVRATRWKRCYLRTLLSSLRPHQQMTAEQVFGSFGWQIDGRPLFNSEAAVAEVLRSMRDESVRFDVASKGWHVTRDVTVPERLRSATLLANK
jgi:hypothetical protein